MTNPTSGISGAQASLLVSLLQAQTQDAALSAIGGAGTAATDGTASGAGTDFAALLGALTGTTGGAGTNLASLLSGTSLDPTLLNSLTGAPAGGATSGAGVASVAAQLAADLQGPQFTSFNAATMPAAAQATFDTPGWGNGNIQCVAFVAGAYHQAGHPLPATPNASQFWSTYANQPGWTETANGQGLPQPGDIIAMSGGPSGYGHVAVVTAVLPPTNGQPGRVIFAQSNSSGTQGALDLAPNGAAIAWPGYSVQGYIRPA